MGLSLARPALLIAIMLAGGAAGACGGGGPAAPSCPNDAPDTCPSPAPAYTMDVMPVIQARCVACHAPGGQEPGMPFQNYTQVVKYKMSIQFEISACLMPPADQPALSDTERLAILGWLTCGALNN